MTLTTKDASTLTPQEQLQARLSDPKVIDALNRLLDRAELLAFSADALDGFIRRGDEITNSVGEMIADVKRDAVPSDLMEVAGKLPQLARAGVHVANTVDKPEFAALVNSGLLEQLGNPTTIEALKFVLSKLDLLAFGIQAVEGFLQRGDEIVDSANESLDDFRSLASSVDFSRLRYVATELPGLLEASAALIKAGVPAKLAQMAEAGAVVVDSGMLDPQTVKVLAAAGKIAAASYVEAFAAPAKEFKGIFALLSAVKDPALQPAISFFIEFMKCFSKRMK